jgi:tellurite resistance protein
MRADFSKKTGGLSYAHCPECMGPLDENDQGVCSYCGANLSSGKSDWVLEGTMPYLSTQRVQKQISADFKGEIDEMPSWAIPDMGSPAERKMLLLSMAAVVMADGIATNSEKKLLKAAAKRWQVPYATVNPVLYGQMTPEQVSQIQPSDPERFVDGLIAAALIDGRIDSKEEKLLMGVAKNMGLSLADTKNRMNELAKKRKVNQRS